MSKQVMGCSYRDACDDYMGWCTVCTDFTRDATEPDAEGYDCPQCGNYTVMGAEQALLTGEIEVYEEED